MSLLSGSGDDPARINNDVAALHPCHQALLCEGAMALSPRAGVKEGGLVSQSRGLPLALWSSSLGHLPPSHHLRFRISSRLFSCSWRMARSNSSRKTEPVKAKREMKGQPGRLSIPPTHYTWPWQPARAGEGHPHPPTLRDYKGVHSSRRLQIQVEPADK